LNQLAHTARLYESSYSLHRVLLPASAGVYSVHARAQAEGLRYSMHAVAGLHKPQRGICCRTGRGRCWWAWRARNRLWPEAFAPRASPPRRRMQALCFTRAAVLHASRARFSQFI